MIAVRVGSVLEVCLTRETLAPDPVPMIRVLNIWHQWIPASVPDGSGEVAEVVNGGRQTISSSASQRVDLTFISKWRP